jgi:hypothetical protein
MPPPRDPGADEVVVVVVIAEGDPPSITRTITWWRTSVGDSARRAEPKIPDEVRRGIEARHRGRERSRYRQISASFHISRMEGDEMTLG